MKTRLQRLLALTALLSAGGCVDPARRLDEFYERSEPFRVVVQPGECSGRLDMSGTYLFALATVVNPSAPILFEADYAIDTGVEPWALALTLQPLGFADRSEVGPALVASGTIAADGTFELDFGEVTILGAANPVVPGVDATATLIVQGCTNGASFSCGAIDGAIISPAQLPLTGSTYGAVAVDADLATKEPVSACPE